MPTTNTRKTAPRARGEARRKFARSRESNQPAPRRRPQLPRTATKPARKGSAGLIERAQASVPGRKAKAKNGAGAGAGAALTGALSRLAPAKNSARNPSKKGIAGIVAGAGLGLVAVTQRRRSGKQDEAPGTATVGEPSGAASASPPA